VLAHPAQHFEAVHVGQHHVERDRVGLELAGRAHGRHATAGGAHLPALVAQRHAQQLGEVVLVVDDEHPRGSAVGALELLRLDRGGWVGRVQVHGADSLGARCPLDVA